MNIRSFFARRTSATAARDRLQILLAHERNGGRASELVATLREEIMAAIAKHVAIDQTRMNVNMKREDSVSIIEIDFEVPETVLARATAVAG
ncbi:cell division topological specificity factor MinE [Terrihabitans sp. B22-R8]|uniref:cell division topological specificity factor MinE n=1 Tax=Terrihabitans sp. B22-R8 TaxID=3425128 RepID=UPI00403CC14F